MCYEYVFCRFSIQSLLWYSVRTSYKLDCEFTYILGWLQMQIQSLEFEIINSIWVHLQLDAIKGVLAGVDYKIFQKFSPLLSCCYILSLTICYIFSCPLLATCYFMLCRWFHIYFQISFQRESPETIAEFLWDQVCSCLQY